MALLVWCGGARCADVRAGCFHFATTRLAIMIGKQRTRYRHRACLCCRWMQRSVWCLSRDKTKSPVTEEAMMSRETYRTVYSSGDVETTA